jgi:serine/threonine protein phosphatase PrpC
MIETITACGASDTGIRRNQNQDHYLIGSTVAQSWAWSVTLRTSDAAFASRGLLCAVADGMGGHVGGAVASRLALETIAAGVDVERDPDGIWLSRLVLRAHDAIVERSKADPDLYNMGTTVVGVHLAKESCTVFHAGDSRLYRFRDGFLDQMTEDHTLAAASVEIENATGTRRSPVLTNAVGGGGRSPCRPAIRTGVSFRSGDTMLLCSDGLTDAVRDIAALEDLLRSDQSPIERARTLIEAANGAGGPDNVTVVLIERK